MQLDKMTKHNEYNGYNQRYLDCIKQLLKHDKCKDWYFDLQDTLCTSTFCINK